MPITAFTYDERQGFRLTQQMIDVFNRDGVLYVRNFITQAELKKLLKQFQLPDGIAATAWKCPDGKGNYTNRSIWSHPGNDVTGMVARSQKVAGTAEKLLGGEVYHYHGKVMLKEPKVGGIHHWHQDYGYWYKNGCLKPDMLTAYTALDKCFRENGCLEVILGSHRCGRLDHEYNEASNQALVTDQERLKYIRERMEHAYVELEPGDTIFFHCNLLHYAGTNTSPHSRWTYLCCYNRADNDPVYKHHHPNYTPLVKVEDSAILECENYTDLSGKEFMKPSDDTTTPRTPLAQVH